MELLERDGEQQALEAAIEESRSAGRIVVVAGDAGIGKTALVSALADRHRVLWGACDPLITPREPIRMPFWDSVSVQMKARTAIRPSRSSISSIWTSTACGTSWRVRRSTCSRTSSASMTRSGWSETSSEGK